MKVVVQVVGPRKSGKTTLIEKLVAELVKLGVRPVVVKQTKHALESVDAGDTKRVMTAGASEVVLLCRDGIRFQRRGTFKLEDVVDSLQGLIIVEGGKSVKRRDWLAVVTWKNDVERKLLRKPLTIAEMGPKDRADLLARELAKRLSVIYRSRGGGSAVLAAFTAQHSANSSLPSKNALTG